MATTEALRRATEGLDFNRVFQEYVAAALEREGYLQRIAQAVGAERLDWLPTVGQPWHLRLTVNGGPVLVESPFRPVVTVHADYTAVLQLRRLNDLFRAASVRLTPPAWDGVWELTGRFGGELTLDHLHIHRTGPRALVDEIVRFLEGLREPALAVVRRQIDERLGRREGEAPPEFDEWRRLQLGVYRFDFPLLVRPSESEVSGAERLERSLRLLRRHLSAEQAESLDLRGYFDVVGGSSGVRYRIRVLERAGPSPWRARSQIPSGWYPVGPSFNVTILIRATSRYGQETTPRLCCYPNGMDRSVIGDVALAQKIALETQEAEFLMEANCTHGPAHQAFAWARKIVGDRVLQKTPQRLAWATEEAPGVPPCPDERV